MKIKIALGLFTAVISLTSIYSQFESYFEKTRYRFDTSSVIKTGQNIQKLITTSPVKISDNLKANVDTSIAKSVSINNINKNLNHNEFIVKKIKITLKDSIEINTKEPIKLKAVAINQQNLIKANWLASYRPFQYEKEIGHKNLIASNQKIQKAPSTLVVLKDTKNQNKTKKKNKQETTISSQFVLETNKQDRISTAQSANEKSTNVENKLTSNDSNQKDNHKLVMQKVERVNDDILFFDYSANDQNEKTLELVTGQEKITSVQTSFKNNNIDKSKNFENEKSNKKSKVLEKKQRPNNKVASSKNPFEETLLKNINDGEAKKKLLANNENMSSQNDADQSLGFMNMSTQNGISKEVFKKLIEPNNNEKPVLKTTITSPVYTSEYSFSVTSATVNGINKNVTNFEVRFADDRDDIIQDFGSGVINLKQKLNSTQAVRRGLILAAGHIPTVVDFVFENNLVNTIIPLITRDKLNNLVTKNNITGLGGHVLVELDDLTEDVELEIKDGYEKKVYLDKNFREIEPADNEYSFMMFMGVRPGNALLTFRTYKNEYSSKIINVANEQVYFDSNFYIEIKGEKIDLFEENLLAKDQLPLNINTNEINLFSFSSKISKKALNRYEVNRAVYPLGTRKYQELKHLGESIFIGHWDKAVIDVPSESYMRFILDNFQISTVSSQCLVQLNLSKSAKQLSYEGDNGNGPMRINQMLLDKDGVFYDEFGQNTHKIFLLGEEQGVINIKIEYADNSIDYVQTFCSDSTYLIEQL